MYFHKGKSPKAHRIFLAWIIAFALLMTFITSSNAFFDNSESGLSENNNMEVVLAVSTEPSAEDADWPVVRIERHEERDTNTNEIRVHRIIIRESPPSYRPPAARLHACSLDPALEAPSSATPVVQASCTYQGSTSRSDMVTVGSVTSHAKNFADRYCSGSCTPNYYKLYRLEVWWTRTNSSWSAKQAEVIWGCAHCEDCSGGVVYQVYNDGPYTPAWQSSTKTYYYVYTSTTFSILQAGFTSPPNGIVDSDAYQNTTYMGHMKAITPFNQ